jgi:hypothetical protein
MSLSRSSAREPTQPNTFQGKNRKNIATCKSTPSRKKNTKKIVKKDPPKLAYHNTDEQNASIVAAQVKAHFAPIKRPPKEVLDPEVVQKFVDNLGRPQ